MPLHASAERPTPTDIHLRTNCHSSTAYQPAMAARMAALTVKAKPAGHCSWLVQPSNMLDTTTLVGSNRFLHKRTKNSSWEGIMKALLRVTRGKDLCKVRHQSLIGRNNASPNLHKTLIICDW